MFSPTPQARSVTRTLRVTFRRTVDAVVSFALLEDVSSPSDTVDSASLQHPHRRSLPSRERSRRPGAAEPREQDCLSPVGGRGRQRQTHYAV